MKIFLKLFAIAAAFGMAPATASAAPAPIAPAPASSAAPAAAGTTAASDQGGNSAAAPAVVAPAQLAPTPGVGQPDGRYGLQDPVSPIGVRGLFFHNWVLVPLIT